MTNVTWKLVSLDEQDIIQPESPVAVDEDRLYADQVTCAVIVL